MSLPTRTNSSLVNTPVRFGTTIRTEDEVGDARSVEEQVGFVGRDRSATSLRDATSEYAKNNKAALRRGFRKDGFVATTARSGRAVWRRNESVTDTNA
ncbi:hypothetical protein C449_06935 [Halococcus saccharolyticus DSM 5350]|uniref:Uncharacterized protein n=1 Tax=Halococcus saccharolyticus DSM 5350 TaxID=1227455 RepID=M0MLK9_9EURY|nr:hypothetical protein C449_06935 [Halococcus saccharolyticus DSM 5350]